MAHDKELLLPSDALIISDLVRDGQPLSIDQYLGLWAIEESAFQAHWEHLQRMDLAAHVRTGEAKSAAKTSKMQNGSLVRIDISGTMTKQGSSMSDAGSTVRVRQEVRAAKNNPDVAGVLLVMDSPGGTVAGTSDLGNDIAELSATKPVVTFAEDLMASAGLWVGFPGAEITDAQKEMWQNLADQSFAEFSAAVMRGRPKITADQMKELSRAGVYPAKQAIALGLIDGVRSLDGAVAELRSMIPTKRKMGARMVDDKPQAATLGQLESACGGANSDFLLEMLRRDASVEMAQREWSRKQDATILELQGQITTLKTSLTEAATAAATVKTAHEAEVTALKAEVSKQTALAEAKTKFQVLPEGKGAGTGTGSATEQFNALIKAEKDKGASASVATSNVIAANEAIYKAMLAEANAGRAA